MIVLGLNSGVSSLHHDPSAVFIKDGKVIFAAEEERYTRVKFGLGQLPIRAIRAGLDYCGIDPSHIDLVAHPGATHQDLAPRVQEWMDHYFGVNPLVKTFNHQLCHVASAFYASGFSDALGLSLDGYGDEISGGIYDCTSEGIRVIDEFSRGKSLGHLYATITSYLGFNAVEDEFKVMGLAPYGEGRINQILWDLLELNYSKGYDDLVSNASEKILSRSSHIKSRYEPWYTKNLEKILGRARMHNTPLNVDHFSVAFTLQKFFEAKIVALVQGTNVNSKKINLVYAGGCALNCTANYHLAELTEVDRFFAQPAASDRGLSLGAAYLGAVHVGDHVHELSGSYLLGRSYGDERIEVALERAGLFYRKVDINSLLDQVGYFLKQGNIIGWFQGRSEFGPRALGGRSILADASNRSMKDTINRKIKFREEFRPFAPMLLRRNAENFFSLKQGINYQHMVVAAKFKSEHQGQTEIPSVWHPNNLGRVQVIDDDDPSLIAQLLRLVDSKHSIPCLINTSFNTAGEPIVETPEDAISTFVRSGIDNLVMSNYLVSKVNSGGVKCRT